NGGDGVVAARLLSPRYNFTVALLGPKTAIRAAESAKNLQILLQQGSTKVIESAQFHIPSLLKDADAVVVAIFGIGFHGKIPDEIARTIKEINTSKKMVFAVDVP